MIIAVEGLFEMLIALYLTFEATGEQFQTFEKIKSFAYPVAFFVMFISLVFLPISVFWISTQSLETIKTTIKFKFIREGIRENERSQIFFYFIFILRRIIYCSICFFL